MLERHEACLELEGAAHLGGARLLRVGSFRRARAGNTESVAARDSAQPPAPVDVTPHERIAEAAFVAGITSPSDLAVGFGFRLGALDFRATAGTFAPFPAWVSFTGDLEMNILRIPFQRGFVEPRIGVRASSRRSARWSAFRFVESMGVPDGKGRAVGFFGRPIVYVSIRNQNHIT